MTTTSNHVVRDGFPGQRMVVLPRPVVRAALSHHDVPGLLPTDIGYFPEAAWHAVDRPKGTAQLVVILCLCGHGWARLNGDEKIHIGPGQVLLIPPHLPHAYGAAEKRPWTIYWIHVAGREATRFYDLLTERGRTPTFTVEEDPELLGLLEDTLLLLQRSYDDENLLLASLATGQMFGRLIRLHRRQPEAASPRQRIERTIEFVRGRLSSKISVPELARLANLSNSHFAMVFKRQTGYTAVDYFARLRMQRAAHLLDTTAYPIKQIAAAVGYDDPLYFSRLFRKIHDLSPAKYRAHKKG